MIPATGRRPHAGWGIGPPAIRSGRYTPATPGTRMVNRTFLASNHTVSLHGAFPPECGRLQVFDRHRLDQIGRLESEDLRVKVQLGFQGPADGGGVAKSVLLSL